MHGKAQQYKVLSHLCIVNDFANPLFVGYLQSTAFSYNSSLRFTYPLNNIRRLPSAWSGKLLIFLLHACLAGPLQLYLACESFIDTTQCHCQLFDLFLHCCLLFFIFKYLLLQLLPFVPQALYTCIKFRLVQPRELSMPACMIILQPKLLSANNILGPQGVSKHLRESHMRLRIPISRGQEIRTFPQLAACVTQLSSLLCHVSP